jgi:hypothetical protein
MDDNQQALNDAVKEFEGLFNEVMIGLPQYLSQTGEPYIEVTNDGPFHEGQGWLVDDFITGKRVSGCTIHFSAWSAINQWLISAKAIASRLALSKPALYWRIKPEVDFGSIDIHAENGLFRMPTWKVYSRFLISDKPRKS